MLSDTFFQARADLGTALFSLSTLAHEMRAPQETVRTLNELGTSLREPFLFVVVGEVKAGKSSLLNALFGREFCKVDVLPATDKIYVFKHAGEERDVTVSPQLTECYRTSPFLHDFNIVDTPGTNTIVPEHEAITRQFLPLADLCLCVFSATNPWGATAWQFLQHLHRKWLKKVIFVLQQRDLRTPAEIESIVAHMEQTMLQKVGERCPIFPVSAKNAWEAKHTDDSARRAEAWEASGFEALEAFISESVTGGATRIDKLRSVCRSAQVILSDFSQQVAAAMDVVTGDLRKLGDLRGVLEERKEQSFRQIGGVLWTIAQTSERTQKRGEELLREKLTFTGTLKLMFGRGGWENFFQAELENRQRETLTKLVRESLELIEADLKSVWKQVHELMQQSFSDQRLPLLPDFARQRKELLDRLELALIERTEGAEFQRQMQRVFADTANWLRVPAGVFAAGGIGAVVAAALTKATILDITGTIAGLGAVTGTVVAVAKRRKIINEYRKQMDEKREVMVQSIEDHLRHAVKRFYVELEQMFQPLEAFCITQQKTVEPSLAKVRELEAKLGKCAASLGGGEESKP
jgi:GTPase SAR1 family protein